MNEELPCSPSSITAKVSVSDSCKQYSGLKDLNLLSGRECDSWCGAEEAPLRLSQSLNKEFQSSRSIQEKQLEIPWTGELLRSPSTESNISPVNKAKAISLWQPWASLISMGIKRYETRSWSTNYRGKLVICSALKNNNQQRLIYQQIAQKYDLDKDWDSLPRGYAIAVCELTDCIKMTPEFIQTQTQAEIDCGDWQADRYAWRLENIQVFDNPIPVKGKQGLWDISLDLGFSNHDTGERSHFAEFKTSLDCQQQGLHNLNDDRVFCGCATPLVLESSNSKTFLEDKDEAEISSRKNIGSQDFLEDKSSLEISSRKSLSNIFLEDKTEKTEISSRKISEISGISDTFFLEDKDETKISSRKTLDPTFFLEDKGETEISSRKTRRHKGDGSGCIYWRTVTKNGKNYQEAYYQYEFWKKGDRLVKSTKYIPKRLLGKVQKLDAEKAPVVEILKVLGLKNHD